MSSVKNLNKLVQEAASAITMACPDELSDISGLQDVLDGIAKCVTDMSELPDALKQAAHGATISAAELVKDVLSNEVENTEDSLKIISETVSTLQQLNDQIERGIDAASIEVDFALPVTDPDACNLATDEQRVEEVLQAECSEEAPESDVSAGEDMVIDEDDIDLIGDFIAEAAEHIESTESGLLELETNTENAEAINQIFRGFHTIKGMAGFLNLTEIGQLAHVAENMLDLARKKELKLVGPNMDVIFESIDMLKNMIDQLKTAIEGSKVLTCNSDLPELISRIKIHTQGVGASEKEAPCPEAVSEACDADTAPDQDETSVQEESSVQEQPVDQAPEPQVNAEQPDEQQGPEEKVEAETQSPITSEPEQQVAEVQEAAEAAPAKTEVVVSEPVVTEKDPPSTKQQAKVKQNATDEKIKVSTNRLDNLVNMVGELVISQSMVAQEAGAAFSPDHPVCRQIIHQGKMVRELQELSMMMRMVPIQGVFQKMARLVRDLCQKSGKKVDFVTLGEDTELDRIVVDQIGDPLVHMIRNSVDHGIESAEERVAAGKKANGRIELRASHQAGSIVIEIEDDGKGLDKDKILQKAVDSGLISQGQEMSDQEIYKLIFNAGFSTAEKVTEVSGRGVGMDVVRKNIESLRGKVEIETTPGKGTAFTIRLPLTMAIIEGQIVRIGSERYIIPIISIEHSLRPTKEQIKTIQGRAEVVSIHGELLPMVRLYKLFGVKPDTEEASSSSLVVVGEDGQRGCLLVDELLGQQQVVIKSLGDGIGMVKGISGAAIMGDGRVRLIFDIPGLLKIAWE